MEPSSCFLNVEYPGSMYVSPSFSTVKPIASVKPESALEAKV